MTSHHIDLGRYLCCLKRCCLNKLLSSHYLLRFLNKQTNVFDQNGRHSSDKLLMFRIGIIVFSTISVSISTQLSVLLSSVWSVSLLTSLSSFLFATCLTQLCFYVFLLIL